MTTPTDRPNPFDLMQHALQHVLTETGFETAKFGLGESARVWPFGYAPWQLYYSSQHGMTTALPESPQEAVPVDSRLRRIEGDLRHAVDIGLENRKILVETSARLDDLASSESRVGLGAIHALNSGRVQLNPPIVYGFQVIGDEVVVGVEELGIYGVGATEREALEEAQEELWELFQDLIQVPSEELGEHLAATLRTLSARIRHNDLDA